MSIKLPKHIQKDIRDRAYAHADECGYMTNGRQRNSSFMDSLTEDPKIGGILKNYMQKENVRTYIKDAVLNRYTKDRINESLDAITPEELINRSYGCDASVIQQCTGKSSRVAVLRASEGQIFITSGGTMAKWETALRKALEMIAKEPKLIVEDKTPKICLEISELTMQSTDADKEYVRKALDAVGVRVVFV